MAARVVNAGEGDVAACDVVCEELAFFCTGHDGDHSTQGGRFLEEREEVGCQTGAGVKSETGDQREALSGI